MRLLVCFQRLSVSPFYVSFVSPRIGRPSPSLTTSNPHGRISSCSHRGGPAPIIILPTSLIVLCFLLHLANVFVFIFLSDLVLSACVASKR